MPVRVVVTKGPKADCSQARVLIEGIKADYLLADRAYDTDDIINKAKSSGMTPVIPPKSIGKTGENTTNIYISYVIWWKTLF